ncbi:hypothetical protein Gogos_016022 [Gossypium gossypioides]|uniref:BZIP domain-containing protein n=1 Tax=Gossypium gossypioides TaxID=34282 RepID=A0A7J9B6C7_GOSGO|nr:hypothetical protein [Gossypium gossypioides]
MGGQGLSNGLIQGGKTGMVDLGGPVSIAAGSPANHFSSDGIGKSSADTSSVSPVPYAFNRSSRGRKCTAVEKVAERQQRRMIKNRESAARYQARKQVYAPISSSPINPSTLNNRRWKANLNIPLQ